MEVRTTSKRLAQLDEDMAQYIHDNTEDELTHEVFINAYLVSKGAAPVNLDQFRTLPSSKATGSQQIGRLTNLMQLSVDTAWFTRYRSRTGNPDLGDTFPQAIPTIAVGQHTAIPRTDDDLTDPDFLQVIANTAGFHFATIEQGGTSLYPKLAQRVNNVEVLRIVLSIGGTEISHFQTWSDKAGNAPPRTAVDPVTGVSATFPDLNSPPLGGEDFQTNLIMPEPTAFLRRSLPACSIIRPTATEGAAMGALAALTADGLFIGQSRRSFISCKSWQRRRTTRGAASSTRRRNSRGAGLRTWSTVPLFFTLHFIRPQEVIVFEGLFQPTHLVLIFGVALLVFGPKKLPELGKGIGEGIRGFKSAMKESEKPSEKTSPPQR